MVNGFLINGMTVETLKIFRNLTKEEDEKYTAFLESQKLPNVFVSDPISTIWLTGHRFVREDEMQTALDEVARLYHGATWVCGGAIGVDSFAAKYAMTYGIKYIMLHSTRGGTLLWSMPHKY
jgi:ligand-binding SRPBCC domain-containing protein